MDSIVETTNGRLRGLIEEGVHVFRGVRYGDTTSGRNRFLPPQPVAKWRGIQDATRFGASAPQFGCLENSDPFFSWYSAIETPSEDCLFLNVFTPAPQGERPILAWIHGGGWVSYSGTAPGFDGTELARQQDVVVATINHRLGVFGHLHIATDDERFADAGNVGLLDIVAALEWLRDNAPSIGGDPTNLTLFGESGGGSKIAALMAMRRAKGLFHRAVIQSTGSGTKLATFDEAEAMAANLARALDKPKLEPKTLQSLPMNAILGAAKVSQGLFRGMIDGRYFGSHPFDDVAPAIATDIPLMIGCTMTECSYYMRGDARNFSLGLSDAQRRLMRFLEIDWRRAGQIVDTYRDIYPDATPSRLLFLSCSDYMFKRCTYKIAELQSSSAQAPVYAYHFEWQTPIEGGRMGSPHTSEVPFIFGTTSAATACVGHGQVQIDMSRRMMATWAEFARTGNPSNLAIPQWTPFESCGKQMMCFDNESYLKRDPSGRARAAFDDLPHYRHGQSILPMVSE